MHLAASLQTMLTLFLLAPAAGDTAELDRVGIGRQIDAFQLHDFRGKEHSLEDYAEKQAVVVVFLGTECPLVQLYGRRLSELQEQYAEQGVQLLGINANRQDNLTEIGAYARINDISFPILKDPRNEVADQFGAERTPEVFVLDHQRVVRYRGRIDDQYGVGYQKAEVARSHLAAAIDEVLAGETVTQPHVEAVGCIIGRVPEVTPTGDVTYSNQIARLMQDRCIECHRTGEIGPFTLTNYEDVAAWGEMIREVVNDGRMPPWFASPEYGEFLDDAHLSDEEKLLINTWVDHGCPQGDLSELPPPRGFIEGWGIKEPDAVFHMSDEPFEVPAEGVINYKYYTVDPGWTEDKWVTASEARPGNRSVVHHILVFIKKPGHKYFPALPGELISAYAPGMKPTVASENMAFRVPAGSKIIFQMHYTANGTPHEDNSYVGFRFVDEADVKMEVESGMAINSTFFIPPKTPDHKVVAQERFYRDTYLLGVNPHMHLRGKSFRYEAFYPDGSREILMDCPEYDFNWQLGYKYVEPKFLPKGTRVVCTAHYDNSADNLNNPDPNRWVMFGEQNWNEMMIGFFFTATKR